MTGEKTPGAEAIDLLRYLIGYEDAPCRLDHHGYCQDHPGGFRVVDDPGFDDGEWLNERPECMVAAARRVVARADATGGST